MFGEVGARCRGEGRDSIGIRGKGREWKQSNMQEGESRGQRFGSDGVKWKTQRTTACRHAIRERKKDVLYVE